MLLLLALVRAATTFVPSMWLWGLNVQRFLPPLVAWSLWSLSLAALHPAVGEWLSRPLARAGHGLCSREAGAWLAGFAGAALVWSLPDRTWIMGDFMLREGWAEGGTIPSFVQSLPIETLLDGMIPRWLTSLFPADPTFATRALGAAAAGSLAVVAPRLARAWKLEGAAACTSAGIIFFGGYLTAFTGLGKPAAVMCVLAALVVLGAVRLSRPEGGGGLLGVSLALALLTHRGALLMVPMWVVALLAARGDDVPGPRREFRMALWLPILAGIIVAPLVVRIVWTLDLPRHVAPAPVRGAGILASAFGPLHLVDLANLLLFYSPLAAALPWIIRTGRRGAERVEETQLLLLAVSFIPLLLFLHPKQGIIRDLEAFAIAGVSFAMLAAYAIGTALERGSLPARMAPALLLAVAVPSLQWLIHLHEPEYGIRRTRAQALEHPARSDEERANLWDGIAYRAFRLRQWDQAAEASAYSVRYGPHPRSMMMLAIARTYTGDHRGAESLYVALSERTPDDPLVWVGLGGAALRVGDSLQISRSLDKLRSYAAGSREARLIRRHLSYFPDVWPRATKTPPPN